MRACYQCGREVPIEGRVPRKAACEGCDHDLRCCRNCRFYDPALSHQCSEPQAEWIHDKERANFCELFEFGDRPGAPGGGVSVGDAARQKWNRLFGDG